MIVKQTAAQLMIKDASVKLHAAMESGDADEIKAAWEGMMNTISESIKEDSDVARNNTTILAQRGYRQLTASETKYYQALIEAGKDNQPMQALTGLLKDVEMPETIIEDVFKGLQEEHPLLAKINFQNVKYLTKWIVNDHTSQSAVWGPINSEITKEITSGFKTVNVTLCKLSAYTIIEKDMLDLGPVYLDAYIRAFLRESLLVALEKGVVDGTGKDQPIGLTRDIHEGVSVTGGVYPRKTAIAVLSFLPAEYGELLNNLVTSEQGRTRNFSEVTLICNMSDYLTKIMPATTILNAAGTYTNNIFPFPTEVIKSNEIETGKAVICLPEEYFMGIGGAKEGVIEYSDEVKFLEDQRVFKTKLTGMGKAYDNTVAILIDITNLDPAYITVKQIDVPIA